MLQDTTKYKCYVKYDRYSATVGYEKKKIQFGAVWQIVIEVTTLRDVTTLQLRRGMLESI